jgi:hypothetical protein
MTGAIEQGLRGVSAGYNRLGQAAERIARDGAGGDLSGNLVELLRARRDIQASLTVIRTADETLGSLIDTFA